MCTAFSYVDPEAKRREEERKKQELIAMAALEMRKRGIENLEIARRFFEAFYGKATSK